jgi:bla regulator protein blaR1
MIPHFLTTLWNASAPAIGNHLWQSTLFACIAALLTLAFRNHRAATRYALWLAGSLKFLIPFSLLVDIGGYFASYRVASNAPTAVYSAVEQFSQPFAESIAPAIPHSAAATTPQTPADFLPILLLIWFCGAILVLGVWLARWRRISATVRSATPLAASAETEIFSRLQSSDGLRNPIAIVSSATSIEPGLFGIFRPVLLWPQAMSARLTNGQTEAILVHELCHARRRDNLTAALHMFVEAAFWFHPMVWWLGARLVDDRERACDEQVVDSGREPQIYAESILKVCEFCVESPLSCVPGVSGADLKRRITRIMARRGTRKLNLPGKLLLTAACVLAITAPILAGALRLTPRHLTSAAQSSTAPRYAAVSIAPHLSGGGENVMLMFGVGEFNSKNASLQQVMRVAYGVEDDRIIGAPAWFSSEKYDVAAKEDSHEASNPQKSLDQDAGQQKRMLQSLLADRLKLAVHRETRAIPTYALTIGAGGPKLKDSDPGAPHPEWHTARDGVARAGVWLDGNAVVGQGIGVAPLLFHLSRILHRTVVDETGLSGSYDFRLTLPDGVGPGIDNPVLPASADPAVVSAVERQLGLRLELRTVPLEVIVIDHVERPATSDAQNVTSAPPPFRIVSIKANKSGSEFSNMNVSLLPGDVSAGTGGLLAGTNVPIISYILFAYRLTGSQLQLLLPTVPNWLLTDRFDIQAQASGNPNNDQLRLVMRGILEDRFKLVSHFQTQQLPLFALVTNKPGETGPQLQPHAVDPLCSNEPLSNDPSPDHHKVVAGGFPADCGRIEALPSNRSDRPREGARNVSMGLLASYLPQAGDLDRPVVDQTGLIGVYDFTFEHTATHVDRSNPHGAPADPAFQQDVASQLGLRLEPQTGPVQVFVLDHVERPTEN